MKRSNSADIIVREAAGDKAGCWQVLTQTGTFNFATEQLANEAKVKLERISRTKEPKHSDNFGTRGGLPYLRGEFTTNHENPPCWIGDRFGSYRWACSDVTTSKRDWSNISREVTEKQWDYIIEHRTAEAAIKAADNCYRDDNPVAITAEVYRELRRDKVLAKGKGDARWVGLIRKYRQCDGFCYPIALEVFSEGGYHWCRFSESPVTPIDVRCTLSWEKVGKEQQAVWPDGTKLSVRKADSHSYFALYLDGKQHYSRTDRTATECRRRGLSIWHSRKHDELDIAARVAWKAKHKPASDECESDEFSYDTDVALVTS